jgi:hypothetical protein
VASVLLGVSDDPIDWGVLREPDARRSQVTKCVEGCLVVIRVQLPLQRLHYAIEHVEPVKNRSAASLAVPVQDPRCEDRQCC